MLMETHMLLIQLGTEVAATSHLGPELWLQESGPDSAVGVHKTSGFPHLVQHWPAFSSPLH